MINLLFFSKRKDLVDDKPVVLFQKPVTLTNLKINDITYENSIIKVNIETLCYNEEKISIENTIPKSPTNFCYKEDNKIVMCEFVTGVKALIYQQWLVFYIIFQLNL